MRLSIISFTENGKRLSESIAKRLDRKLEISLYTKCEAGERGADANIGNDAHSDVLPVKISIGDWTGEQMREKNPLLFIGACGIAVRAIAPFLTDKLQDVPVLVMDEKGRYIIPILSGHMGGANELANRIADKTGAVPVITTATDIHGKFAVDLFAKRNHLYIADKEGIVKVSSKVLAGKEVTISIEGGPGIIGEESDRIGNNGGIEKNYPPDGVRLVPYPPGSFVDVVITSKEDRFDAHVLLKPREYVLGIGCKRGKSVKEIDDFISKEIAKTGISTAQIFALSSISQKRDEQGIVEWCQKKGIPFLTYTAEELQEVNGDFTESSFVKTQVGVDSVCERAAMKACGADGRLLVPKTAENGMTIAIARRKWKVCFDGE